MMHQRELENRLPASNLVHLVRSSPYAPLVGDSFPAALFANSTTHLDGPSRIGFRASWQAIEEIVFAGVSVVFNQIDVFLGEFNACTRDPQRAVGLMRRSPAYLHKE